MRARNAGRGAGGDFGFLKAPGTDGKTLQHRGGGAQEMFFARLAGHLKAAPADGDIDIRHAEPPSWRLRPTGPAR